MNSSPPMPLRLPANHPYGRSAAIGLAGQGLYSWGPTIAKFCYVVKQHIASGVRHIQSVPNQPINHVLADNLRHFMERKGMNQTALGFFCARPRRKGLS